MKILLLWDYYPGYLRFFYERHPAAATLPYWEQLRALLGDFFYWPPYLISQLRALGHEAELVIGNNRHLQSSWARENGFAFHDESWRFSIAREQIRRFRPDVLIFGGSDDYFGSFVQDAKLASRWVVAWKAVAFSNVHDWAGVDCVFSSHSHFVDQFRRSGIASEQVLPCFEPKILEQVPLVSQDIGVSFVGTLSTIQFRNRIALLDHVRRRVPINIYTEGISWRRRPWPIALFLGQIHCLPFALMARTYPAVYGLEMFHVLRRSKIVLNSHVDSAGGLAGNIRMFETTGMGSLLVTEAAPNLRTLFEPDREVVTYRSNAEAVEKIQYYLAHEDERIAIARAGQQRTLRDHNSCVRAQQIADILKQSLAASRP